MKKLNLKGLLLFRCAAPTVLTLAVALMLHGCFLFDEAIVPRSFAVIEWATRPLYGKTQVQVRGGFLQWALPPSRCRGIWTAHVI